ncbi:MAG TPA: LysE family transporter [Microvirga sp.]|nr:LysE family transporter [Microvirga sp.]
MSLEIWLVYCIAAVGLSLTPGPNGLLSLTHGACFGFRPTIYTVMGGALGFFVLIAASLAGMGTLLAASERAFTIAKWIGAAYLVWLGVRVWRAPAPVVSLADQEAGSLREARPLRMFNQGFLVAVSNPKALIFFAAFLPQFMMPGVSYPVQLAVFGGTFVAVEIVYELLLAVMAQRIAPWLARHGRWFNRAAGATFVGIGAALTTASR